MTSRHQTHSSSRRHQASPSLPSPSPQSTTVTSPTRHRQQQITPPPSQASLHQPPQPSAYGLRPHQYPTAATLSLLPTTTTTVVTTTTTKTTTFPPLVLPPPPKVLDKKLYPLADTPTPPALKKFCFDLNGQPTWFREDDDAEAALRKVSAQFLRDYLHGKITVHTTETIVQTTTQSNLPPGMESPSPRSPLRTSPRKRPASPFVVPTYDHHDPGAAMNAKAARPSAFERPFRKIASPPHKRPRGPIIPAESGGRVDDDDIVVEMDKEGTPESLSSGEDYTQEEVNESRGPFTPTVVRATITTVDTPSPVSGPAGHILSPGLAPLPYSRVRSNSVALGVSETSASSNMATMDSALPSPSLSPITAGGLSAAANLESYFNNGESALQLGDRRRRTSYHVQDNEEQDGLRAHVPHMPSLLDLPTMFTTFDAVPDSLKNYLLFHFVRRSPQSTLQFISSLILPALKRDFLGGLPYELSLHILRFLDVKSMCRAAQVNKKWRVVVDADPGTWRRKLESNGFKLEEDEEERAINENWGLFGLQKRKRIADIKKERDASENNHVKGESSRAQVDSDNVMMAVDEPVTRDTTVPRRSTRRESKAKEESMWVDSDREVGSSRGASRRQNRIEGDHQDVGVDADIDDDDDAGSTVSSLKGSTRRTRKVSDRPHVREVLSKTRRSKRASKAAVYNDDTETGSSTAEHSDHHMDDDAMSQNSDDWSPQIAQVAIVEPKLPLPRSAEHPYKAIYRRHHIIRQNWDRGDARHISFQGHGNNVVTCLQFDNDKILSGSDDHCINVYDTNTGEKRKTLEGHDGGVWALQYVGNTLVSGSTDRTVRVWDIERGVCTHVFLGHTSTVRCLQIVMPTNVNPDPHGPPIMEPEYPLIVTGSRDSTLKVWKLPDPAKDPPYLPDVPNSPADHPQAYNPYFRHTLTGHTHSVRALAAVGNILVSGSYDNSIRVWNIWTGEPIHHMEGHTQKVYSVVLDPSRKRCMSGSMDSTVKIWSLEDGSCIGTLDGHSMLVGLLGLSNNYLVSAAADSSLRIWSATSGACQHVLMGHHGAITCFQHDDRKVISGSDGGLKMWDIETGKLTRDLITNLNGVWRVAFDERRCVCAVRRNDATFFEVLDFGVHNLEEQDSLEGIDAGNGRVIVGPGYGCVGKDTP
ncbi:WD40-repeat-containing domain protein [Jimgerdemannia flammicorona]|uniref:WD40-repeat-containing domain protein n=1 Tax=Jimgerdemannia flammicorona TaxID=994334 RepID=A0A433DLL3_9FUNG|nr:WD40-repeat-containing domain protein [Jimgerdemannia flammicorona]